MNAVLPIKDKIKDVKTDCALKEIKDEEMRDWSHIKVFLLSKNCMFYF